ncbi:MAG: polysaccharide biosynthesis protein [Clostridiales bacterium]|nr:polysaccharide biosynthesis protein [Clostridiales bacterium]
MKYRNQFLFIIIDAGVSLASILAAVFLRFEGLIPPEYQEHLLRYYPIAAISIVLGGAAFGTYQSVLQYMGFADAFRQFSACAVSSMLFFVIKYTGMYPVSGSITVIYFGVVFMATTGFRLIPRFRHWLSIRRHTGAKRTLIIGAGSTGAMVIKRLEESTDEGLYPVVAVDDDPGKLHMRVAGVTVAARLNQIPRVIKNYRIEEAILAIPSLEAAKIAEIYQKCASSGIKLSLFRSAVDMESYIAGDRKALSQVAIEDLLFRDSIVLDKNLIFQCLQDKTVLVTGGAGSIGSEICRQALVNGCGKLIIFDIDENGLFDVNEDLKRLFPPEKYALCLGSIQDEEYLGYIFSTHKPDLVFHAAAHKHVPMVELNPFEAVKNNIIGTENVIRACHRHGVERFILISTDKAVHPANIMGACKRVAELLTLSMGIPTQASVHSATSCKMAAVRFGNVLASAGSVIPTFQKQIEMGGPVTVTHQDMERYFITIHEAVSLVMVACTLTIGGEIFLLDMGDPVKIYDLASELIRLSGFEPEKDIKIELIGIRPGDKLSEELVLDSEQVNQTVQDKLLVMKSKDFDTEAFFNSLAQIKEAAQAYNLSGLSQTLMETVERFS